MRRISKKTFLMIGFAFVLLLTVTSTVVAKNNIKAAENAKQSNDQIVKDQKSDSEITTPAKAAEPVVEVKVDAPSKSEAKAQTFKQPVKSTKPTTKNAPASTQTSKPASSSPTTVAPVRNSQISDIVYYINLERAKVGLKPVVINNTLNSAALAKSNHMVKNNYFAHTAPNGISDINFVQDSGYKYKSCGINLAMGDFGSSKGLVDAWMNSAGHKKNILADFGEQIGIGVNGKYYTMVIAKPL